MIDGRQGGIQPGHSGQKLEKVDSVLNRVEQGNTVVAILQPHDPFNRPILCPPARRIVDKWLGQASQILQQSAAGNWRVRAVVTGVLFVLQS